MAITLIAGTAEHAQAQRHLDTCAEIATTASCLRSRCGSVVARGAAQLGTGRNDPPNRCAPTSCGKDTLPAGFRSDRTCCVHAEQNAILEALRDNPSQVAGARIYFLRLGADSRPAFAGAPYCTSCSKLTQAAGIAEFVLWHQTGITVYGADEYNRLSYRHADAGHV
jgi:deoxycytidylate deaminase